VFGRRGIQIWDRMAESRRKYLTGSPPELTMKRSFQGCVPPESRKPSA
jgi:hypothetical protein